MADYNCWIRTNYFRVTDEEALRRLLDTCATNDQMELHEKEDEYHKYYCFCCGGQIYGIPVLEDEEEDYDAFIKGLQAILPPGEAILIQEAGHEKLRYLEGSVLVITATQTKYMDIKTLAVQEAVEMVGNPFFETDMDA